MPFVEVLFEGYANTIENSENLRANCTCTLVRSGCNLIIVDTLTAWDRDNLIHGIAKVALNSRSIVPDDITWVVCTHGHSDHIGNINIFVKAKGHFVGTTRNHRDVFYSVLPEEGFMELAENVRVIATPGHTGNDVSVVVSNVPDLGCVVVAGDLFERFEDIQYPLIWREQAGSENPKQQAFHRQRVLNMASAIIPGHGPMFMVTEELRALHATNCADLLT